MVALKPLLMEFWKRIGVLKPMKLIDENEIGIMLVMDFGNEPNPCALIWFLTI